jgi:hypothetical protein
MRCPPRPRRPADGAARAGGRLGGLSLRSATRTPSATRTDGPLGGPSLRGVTRALGGGALGVLAAVLVSCGGSGAGLIPAENSSPLLSDFQAVERAAKAGNGSCGTTQAALRTTEQDFHRLPTSIDAGLHGRLAEGIRQLRATALEMCEQPLAASTTSTGEASTPTKSQAKGAPPSSTTSTETTTTSTGTSTSPTSTTGSGTTGTTQTPTEGGTAPGAEGNEGQAGEGSAGGGQGGADGGSGSPGGGAGGAAGGQGSGSGSGAGEGAGSDGVSGGTGSGER